MKKMWAWYDEEKDTYHHIYHSKFLVEVCSPDEFQSKIKSGEGDIVEVKVCHLLQKEVQDEGSQKNRKGDQRF